ncbi:MAG: glycosyltransferase [Candidatus Calescibacterium sp.]|nr:glycosyltransferase [Candidatus Calescibacterium sp.]MDW8087899.1 glycosyltransferase family 2 protein [Candidatus Calescibacterium sp.]
MKNGLVSVIIPTYNRAHLVRKSIESVLNQTYRNVEVIVVDDGSNDNTEEVVKSIKDKRVKYIKHERNYGPAHARNTGVNSAEGEFIAILDSDDLYMPQKIEKQIELFKSESIGGVYCDSYNDAGKEITYRPMPKVRGYVYKQMLYLGICIPTFLFRAKYVKQIGGFDETTDKMCKMMDDIDFLIRISRVCEFDYIPEPLIVINRNPEHSRLSGKKRCTVEAWVYLLNKYKSDMMSLLGKSFLDFRYSRLSWSAYIIGERYYAARICVDGFLTTKNISHILKIPFILSGTYGYIMRMRYGKKINGFDVF